MYFFFFFSLFLIIKSLILIFSPLIYCDKKITYSAGNITAHYNNIVSVVVLPCVHCLIDHKCYPDCYITKCTPQSDNFCKPIVQISDTVIEYTYFPIILQEAIVCRIWFRRLPKVHCRLINLYPLQRILMKHDPLRQMSPPFDRGGVK